MVDTSFCIHFQEKGSDKLRKEIASELGARCAYRIRPWVQVQQLCEAVAVKLQCTSLLLHFADFPTVRHSGGRVAAKGAPLD